MQTIGLVLAAGQGTRMKSKLSKVMHPLCGKPLIGHVIDALQQAGVQRNVLVIGRDAESVQQYVGQRAEYAVQDEQLGTAHAVMAAKPLLQDEAGELIVAYGDMPLIRAESLAELVAQHRSANAAGTIMSAQMTDPHGYGRIIRDERDEVIGIVEQKDCSSEQARIQEINTGIYCFDNRKLFAALDKVNNDNAQQEYYLTDVMHILREQGERIQAYRLDDHSESIGINDRAALGEAARELRQRINDRHLANGVTIIDPAQTYIDEDVTIGMDTVIYPGTYLTGATEIGEDCIIGPNSEIEHSIIGNEVNIKQSVLRQAEVGDRSNIGPFAHLRPGTKLETAVRIGNFAETKNATIGEDSAVAHLSYVGDATVGKRVNIGCGAITVNFDGYHKHVTKIEDDAFVGSNVNLIAPVKIGKQAFVVAGSTITEDVEDGGLAIARSRQTTKHNYANKVRARLRHQHDSDG